MASALWEVWANNDHDCDPSSQLSELTERCKTPRGKSSESLASLDLGSNV